jgi:hypothetical protein
MPDMKVADGTRLFEHLQGSHATQVTTREGVPILIRPDGYIASLGAATPVYMGEGVRTVHPYTPNLDRLSLPAQH